MSDNPCKNSRWLYHQTSKENWEAIQKEGKMLRGSRGLAGPGIYFAETSNDTDHKAQNRGIVFTVPVCLGKIKTIPYDGDNSITYHSLRKEGYDSIKILRNGDEFVVYSYKQVQVHRAKLVAERAIQVHNFRPYHPSGWINTYP